MTGKEAGTRLSFASLFPFTCRFDLRFFFFFTCSVCLFFSLLDFFLKPSPFSYILILRLIVCCMLVFLAVQRTWCYVNDSDQGGWLIGHGWERRQPFSRADKTFGQRKRKGRGNGAWDESWSLFTCSHTVDTWAGMHIVRV